MSSLIGSWDRYDSLHKVLLGPFTATSAAASLHNEQDIHQHNLLALYNKYLRHSEGDAMLPGSDADPSLRLKEILRALQCSTDRLTPLLGPLTAGNKVMASSEVREEAYNEEAGMEIKYEHLGEL